MQENIRQALRRAFAEAGVSFTEGEPLAPHTTFRIGGPAAFWCRPENADQVSAVLAACEQFEMRHYLLGNGSNTLFSDAGFDGVVVSLTDLAHFIIAEVGPNGWDTVHVSAGVSLGYLCVKVLEFGLKGLEFAYGIPGTVGGAVYMNAGAYGGEMKDVLYSVTALDKTGTIRTLPVSELALGYRTSVFETTGECVLDVTLRLQRGDREEILSKMKDFMQRRKDKQPLEYPSAGSTFKRPQGAFAGKLIEDCGLRGFAVGGAQISEKHCGFVINKGGASCADVVALTDRVREIVEQKTGYLLEREIRVVE